MQYLGPPVKLIYEHERDVEQFSIWEFRNKYIVNIS